MRPILVVLGAVPLLALSLAACGGDGGTDPVPGVLVVEAAMNCTAGPMRIAVDGNAPVPAQMIPGAAMRSFSLTPGRHTVSAERLDGSMSWGPIELIIPSKETLRLVIQC